MNTFFYATDDLKYIQDYGTDYIYNTRDVTTIKSTKQLESMIRYCYMPRHYYDIVNYMISFDVSESECSEAVRKLVTAGILIDTNSQPSSVSSIDTSQLASLTLLPTMSCNLNCTYCYNRNILSGVNIDTKRWESIINDICDIGTVGSIIVSGGEPLLRPDVIDLLSILSASSIDIVLGTNAMLIDDNMARSLKDTITTVSVSLDSHIPEIHDAARGIGSFEAVVKGCRLLTKHGVKWQAQSVLTKANSNDIARIKKFALDLGASRYTTSLELLNDSYDGCDYLQSMHKSRYDWSSSKLKLEIHKMCGIGRSYSAIGPDGHLYPCHLLVLDEFKGDSVVEVGLKESWRRLKNSKIANECDVELIPECNKCMYKYLCAGGCRGLAYLKTGKINGYIGSDACMKFRYDFGNKVSASIKEKS